MALIRLTGEDTLVLNNRLLQDFANGDTGSLTFANDLVTLTTGKNQNTIFAKNAGGRNGELVLRLMMGSSDDRFFNGKLLEQERDFASTVLLNGVLSKRLGDGASNIVFKKYSLESGIVARVPDAKENVDGDIEQAVVLYTLRFASVTPSIE